ncbi:MAG TPA: L-lactate permease [Candidatus Acidoferrum sp.]|nr:L-lactate permease [Candidatus Acidoferrum sp.]
MTIVENSAQTPANDCVTPPQAAAPGRSSPVWLIIIAIAAILLAYKIYAAPSTSDKWSQNYDPTGHWWLSTIFAALPVVVLLGTLAFLRVKAHYAALLGLVTSLCCAIWMFGMPARMAAKTAVLGACYGLFPIGWIILNIIFMYQLSCDAGLFKVLQQSLMGVTQDRRLQLILVAFSFGSFFEGAAGFGTPVAVTAALLIGLGFGPLEASALSLIANTAPVAYGALGTPIIALQAVTGLDLRELSAQVGRILPFFAVLVPFWMTWAFVGFRSMMQVWPAALVAGVFFAIPQFLMSNYHGPWLVDVVSAVISMFALILFLRAWRPKQIHRFAHESETPAHESEKPGTKLLIRAWVPWLILSLIVFAWGLPSVKARLDKISSPKIPVAGLHQMVNRVPPVVAKPAPEAAVFSFNWLTATGSGILIASWIAGIVMGFTPWKMLQTYFKTILRVRFSLLTIAAMLALGFLTRYSGLDATMGLAFAKTGVLYPFFGTLLGWLGVALTGSDTSSNVLFGSLQKISAQQIGISPTLMGAANSAGGVMGKMIDAQSIVVASTATEWYGHEGTILRYVFFHSLALAALVGLLVTMQAYLPPLTRLVVR